MWHALMTILVFIGWGLTWGSILGALSGTLIFPGMGTAYAVFWGAGMGSAMGLVTGILAVLSDRFFRHEKMNLQSYRRKLSAAFGTITSIGVTILLIATSRGILWGASGGYYTDMRPFLVLSLIAGISWGWLGAAYTAARYVDSSINDALPPERINSVSVVPRIMWAAANRWTFIFGILAGSAYNALIFSFNYPSLINRLLQGAIFGLVGTVANIFLLGLTNGFFLLFANRLFFKEYAPHLTLAQYKNWASVLAFFLTLFTGLLVTAVVFAPFAAFIAAIAVRSYADWLYAGEEKFKRKSKENYEHLEWNETDEDDVLMEGELPEQAAEKI